jgi:hypothetical protein
MLGWVVRDRTLIALLIPKVSVVPFPVFLGLSNKNGLHARAPHVFVLGQNWQVHQTEFALGEIGFSPDCYRVLVQCFHLLLLNTFGPSKTGEILPISECFGENTVLAGRLSPSSGNTKEPMDCRFLRYGQHSAPFSSPMKFVPILV